MIAAVMVGNVWATVDVANALTPSGQGIATPGSVYWRGSKRKQTPAWRAFYAALLARDCAAIIASAARLPSVRIKLDTSMPGNPNFGFTVGVGGWTLFVAPLVP